jgi:GldM C-terminal domain
MAELAGGRVIEFDAFFPVVSAKKSYLISGEPFEAEISVGTYSSQINPSDIGIFVNGSKISVGNDGKAKYTARTDGLGEKTLKLDAQVRNPLTGEVSKGSSTFTYEVGQRSVAISADKMNVFYIGVDNPISVSAAGSSSNDLQVSISGGGGQLSKNRE